MGQKMWCLIHKPKNRAIHVFSGGGYAVGLVLQKAIQDADSVDSEAVKDMLNAMNMMAFYGGIQFDTSEEAHGLQIAHKMVVAQWQLDDAGAFVLEIVAPAATFRGVWSPGNSGCRS